MIALTVLPRTKGSLQLDVVPEPVAGEGEALVQTHSIGVCGTDREIVAGAYGSAPPGSDRLILGHESLGRILEAPTGQGFSPGDWVVAMVRHPDPVPCRSCAVGEWDMCRNGRYTEHGIKGLNGFGRERYRANLDRLVKVNPRLGELGVLLEPASVVAKAWEQAERIGQRAHWTPRRVLVTGAGPIGLLAALLGVQRGLEVCVLDQVTQGPKPGLVRSLGAHYTSGAVSEAGGDWDLIFECTGVAALITDAVLAVAADGIVCLTGVSTGGRTLQVDVGAMNREVVLENNVVFGSVSANRRHYEQAAQALAQADLGWLTQLISRRVPVSSFAEAFAQGDGDVKTVITFPSAAG